MATPLEPTDRRIQRTQQTLRMALLELIDEKGYAAVTVQDIAERANIGRATFYLHYPDKEHLLLAWMEHILADLKAQFAGRPETLSFIAFEHIAHHRDLYRTLLSERGSALITVRMRNLLAGEIEDHLCGQCGVPAGSIPAFGLVGQHVAGALFAAIHWWLNSDQSSSPAQMSELHELLITPGLDAAVRSISGMQKSEVRSQKSGEEV
ncbi:MAG TPA: TetR/AcrR family transcriptional regulator [Herpetosiphonaceae bacterium]|nr:TetR/AcrR family transcriptional regulator [Herpetosiphonaceae bacterium]